MAVSVHDGPLAYQTFKCFCLCMAQAFRAALLQGRFSRKLEAAVLQKSSAACAKLGCMFAGKFWWYTLYIFLTMLYYTYYGLFAIVVAPSLQVSSVACTIFYALWNLFSGVLITLPQMPVRPSSLTRFS